ncbi:SMI1/KNR4 family protein [Bailinhaonella thermotolerans]|uniref:Knr4/Smi1-like domain-containing protein n=1 Tax=Bailinhaonella thermotolerans TaxID=1070861 RepID=A0A3A4AQS3_9ACTN|nr:SMI1/KNR4 family protein [Bailinhaonella thermotolerans]RJL31441.1 hypothetical protein D5H75_20650 [Bailinhaonella thermotolerans]
MWDLFLVRLAPAVVALAVLALAVRESRRRSAAPLAPPLPATGPAPARRRYGPARLTAFLLLATVLAASDLALPGPGRETRPPPATPAEAAPPPREESLTPGEVRRAGCAPAKRRPVVRPVNPRTKAAVDRAWDRIERWLRRRAPGTYRTLGEPATPLRIARAEAAMGLRFPDGLKASLLRHDGGFPMDALHDLSDLDVIVSDWRMLCGILADGPIEAVDTWWHGKMIPFASAGDGGNQVIDARNGAVGNYYNEEGLSFDGDRGWPSYLAMLRDIARSLEKGRRLRGDRPVVRDGRLDWDLE